MSEYCKKEGCNELRAKAGSRPDGKTIYRKKCLPHYLEELVEKKRF